MVQSIFIDSDIYIGTSENTQSADTMIFPSRGYDNASPCAGVTYTKIAGEVFKTERRKKVRSVSTKMSEPVTTSSMVFQTVPSIPIAEVKLVIFLGLQFGH